LGAASHWECEPQDKNKLKCVVEWEPIDSANGTLENRQESENDPIRQPLGVVGLADTKQGLHRVIPRNHKPGDIGEKLPAAPDVKEDQDAVDSDQSEESVDFGD